MLTNERLKEVLHYDSLTGIFTWKLSVTNSVRVGDVAGRGKSKSYEHKLKISLTKTGISCSNKRKENIRKACHDRLAKQILTNISNPMRIQNGD